MNAPCARCQKTVYPVEKLSVLDKVWHKGCFKCETCALTLTLKTYKGYNKSPYCNVHYPTTAFTAVADTPENLRLKKQTDNLSLINYHKNYNTSVKGTKMSVADDPESVRAKKSQQQLSSIKYHGKDRTNPSTTPLSRPAFSAPGYVIAHKDCENGELEDGEPPVRTPSPDIVSKDPEPEAPPAPEPVAEPEPIPEPVPEPEPLPEAPPAEEPKPSKVEDDEPAAPEVPAPEVEAPPPPEEFAPPAEPALPEPVGPQSA
ncbi:hypothetical protein ACHWQZ_G009051 [Mnemiopsis leidyi]